MDENTLPSNLKGYFNALNDIHTNLNHKDDEPNPSVPNCKYVDINSFKHSNKNSAFSLFHLNIASLGKHKDDLEIALKMLNFKFDILGLTETKIQKEKTPIYDINISGYKSYVTPTESTKGGTILYVDNDINCKTRFDLENKVYKTKELESSFIEIVNTGKKNTIVACIYRHPSMDLNEFTDFFLNPLMAILSKENKNLFLMGDFNADLMKADLDISISHYFDCLISYLLSPHIILPTQIAGSDSNFSQTLIDNIFSNSLNHMEGVSGNLTFSISDHLAQFLIIPSHKHNQDRKSEEVYKRNTKNFDRENFILDLLEVNWKDEIQIEKGKPSFSFHKFETKLFSVIDKYMPLRKLTKKRKQ